MSISGSNSVNGSPLVRPVSPTSPPRTNGVDAAGRAETSPIAAPRDEVEISSAGRMMNEVASPSELRSERLARIKAAIDDGTYETAEKLEAALSRMIGAITDDE
jgi:negative regulator of flagellin synthesis FlgM